MTNRVREIKHAQREALLYKEISNLFIRLIYDEPSLSQVSINRVELSPDRSVCTVYFYSADGILDFDTKLHKIILYKPSLRSALAKILHGRYVPDLVFKYDEKFEKQKRVEDLIDKLKAEGKL